MEKKWQILLKEDLINQYIHQKQKEWIDVSFSTSGRLNLTIVSDQFINLSMGQRKEKIFNFLQQNFPKISTGFLSLYTTEEAESFDLSPSPSQQNTINTWQDLALLAANPQNQEKTIKPQPSLPRTVTFYSFKGGVGRTTALTHVAWILAMRGHKVVAVDLDLEAPGLSTSFTLTPQPKYGIVDYFYERSYLPEAVKPNIPITEIFGEVNIPNATGRLFIVPAGFLNLDYIAKVDDLRATTIIDTGENLWSIFTHEIQNHLKPDIILVDSRTGINEWGALSLLQAADEAIIFLYPNEQNWQGIDLLLKSLQSFGKLSINFVFSPIPDLTETGMTKVRNIWYQLCQEIQPETDNNDDKNEEDIENIESELSEPLVIPYLQPIALADSHPVTGLLDYYTKIANLIDEETQEIKLQSIFTDTNQRWQIIENLQFPPLNAADPRQELDNLFQKTANFGIFLDAKTSLIRGRKGTGKTALYFVLLQHQEMAKKLANTRLDNVILLSGHGAFQPSRPTRNEFEIIHRKLNEKQGNWESFWRSYLLLNVYQQGYLKFPTRGSEKDKFKQLQESLKDLSKTDWTSENTEVLIQFATDDNLRLIIPDALGLLNEQNKEKNQTIWFLYDDLDEDFPEQQGIRQSALTGLFQLIQFCDARRLTTICFKVFLREDIWNRLNFDNKSHFNGRDLELKWTRVDFLRLALRQATQSKEFKGLLDRTSPVEDIDQASEETLNKALELLWGSRRRKGNKAKYVYRWVYERLTDSSDTTFPRSLSVLLQGAKEQELTYKGQTSVQPPTDRFFRAKSLEIGLEKASEERCSAIRQEYPDLCQFFDALDGKKALLEKHELEKIWQETVSEILNKFNDFTDLLSTIGLAKWREKEQRYGFADLYVYGFKMSRTGTK